MFADMKETQAPVALVIMVAVPEPEIGIKMELMSQGVEVVRLLRIHLFVLMSRTRKDFAQESVTSRFP